MSPAPPALREIADMVVIAVPRRTSNVLVLQRAVKSGTPYEPRSAAQDQSVLAFDLLRGARRHRLRRLGGHCGFRSVAERLADPGCLCGRKWSSHHGGPVQGLSVGNNRKGFEGWRTNSLPQNRSDWSAGTRLLPGNRLESPSSRCEPIRLCPVRHIRPGNRWL